MILLQLIDLYSLVVLVSVVLSWIQLPYHNPAVRFVASLTEPLLGPIRSVLPPMAGLDFSPFILLIGLHFLKRILAGAMF
jgi:YggT family protein